MKAMANRFSCENSPGATKRQVCHNSTGIEAMSPPYPATEIRTLKGSKGLRAYSWHPEPNTSVALRSDSGSERQYGSSRKSRIHG